MAIHVRTALLITFAILCICGFVSASGEAHARRQSRSYGTIARAHRTPREQQRSRRLHMIGEANPEVTAVSSAFLNPSDLLPQGQLLWQFYQETAGSGWISSSGWGQVVDHCTWFGVLCVNGNLEYNNLYGHIPAVLGSLTTLQNIGFSSNALYGGLPDSMSQLTQLQSVYLDFNNLNETLPDWMGSLVSLQHFTVSTNNMHGGFPTSLLSVTGMQTLFLDTNQFSGPLPANIGALKNLVSIFLYDNNFSGTIPESIGDLTSLQYLDLDSNQFTGPIPDSLGRLSSVRAIWLYSNHLTGSIPPSLFNCSSLQQLYLYSNNLTGTIPIQMSGLRTLAIVDISYNQLSGSLNIDLFSWPSVFAASNNFLSGPLPTGFPQSGGNMFYLDLSSNNFFGPIPDFSLSLGPQLSFIDLTNNPGVQATCSVTGAATAQCLPPTLLALSDHLLHDVSDGIVCPTIVGAYTGLSANIDPVYLNYQQCYCNPGYFQTNSPQLTCLPCSADCVCEKGLLSGCYPSPFRGNWTVANPCPILGLDEYACNPNATVAGVVPNTLFACAPGYTNRLCSQCEIGYYLSGRECIDCPWFLQWLLPCVYVVLLLLLAAYLLNVPGAATGFLKILLFYGQTTWVLIRSAGVGWPVAAFGVVVQHASSFAGLSVTALECVVPGTSFTGVMGIYVGVPLFLVFLALAIYLVGRVIAWKRQIPFNLWRERCIYMAMFLLYGTYFNITIKMLDLFGCTIYDAGEDQMYLNLYPYIACDVSQEYGQALPLVIVGVLLWVIGIPTLQFTLLYRWRGKLEESRVSTMIGFVYQSYRTNSYWWEVVNVVRRLILAGLLAIVPFTSPQVAVLLVLGVLQCCIVFQHAFHPFHTKLENRLELASLYVLLISFVGAYVAQEGNITGKFDPTALLLALIILNAVFAFVIFLLVIGVYVILGLGRLQWLTNYISFEGLKKLSETGQKLRAQLLEREDTFQLMNSQL